MQYNYEQRARSVWQHIVLALKLLVAYAIPDIPDRIAEEKARLEFLRREALKVWAISWMSLGSRNVADL